MATPIYPPSQLDASQVLQHVYDDATQRLRTEGAANIDINGDLEVAIDAATDSIKIAGSDGTIFDNTVNGGKNSLDVNITGGVVSGTFTASGLANGLVTTSVIIGDTVTALPPSPLTNRNSISIRIWGSNIVYIGNSGVTVGQGYPKRQFEEIILDIKDNAAVKLYALCAPGEQCEVRIIELS